MLRLCPFCGAKIRYISDGITTCDHCKRIIISSSKNRVLSAAWMVRNWHVEDLETLKRQCDLTDSELLLVKEWVVENQLIHDEFITVLDKI